MCDTKCAFRMINQDALSIVACKHNSCTTSYFWGYIKTPESNITNKGHIVFNKYDNKILFTKMRINISMSKLQIIKLKQLCEKNDAKLKRNEIKLHAWLTKVDAWREQYMDHPQYHINHPEEQYFRKVKAKLDQKIEKLKRDKEQYSQIIKRQALGEKQGSRSIKSRLGTLSQQMPTGSTVSAEIDFNDSPYKSILIFDSFPGIPNCK